MHPLDPLTADEVRAAAQIIRRERATTESWRFASIDLAEPAKAELLAGRAYDALPRRAFAVLWDRSTNEAYEAVADLTAGRVETWTPVPGMTPNVTIDEYHDIDVALHQHPEVLAALARRGIADPAWCCSTSGPTARR
jgi:primary-amine oxidase